MMSEERPQERWLILLVLLLVFALVGLARLFDLQIIRGGYFRQLAEGNRLRHIPLKAPRGEILDRNGRQLATNAPVYKLATFGPGGAVTQTQEITREEALKIQAEDPEKAARIIVDVGRSYPLGPAASHVLGYVGEATGEEVAGISNCPTTNYQLGDLVGRSGVEQQHECELRGVNGEELIEVDTTGRLVRKLGRREPVSGKNLTLSIDAGLQEAAYQALIRARELTLRSTLGEVVRGAVVAQNPKTGEILALVSSPSFDPNTISSDYPQLSGNPDLPLFNRAIGGAYHPGSTFKVVTAAAGLEEGKIDAAFTFDDPGIIRLGDFSFANWFFSQYGKTEGTIDIVRAIKRSTDTFFYKVGELVGVNRLADWAGAFGLGRKLGIDIPGEVEGLVPTPEWKEKARGERWFLGNTYHMSIGQGDIATTPLQINAMTSVIASGGKLCQPQVAKDAASRSGQFSVISDQCRDLRLRQETLKLIVEGMTGACQPGGTAFPFFNFQPQVGCKTGTAEFGDPEDQTHAWLTAFSPSENPEIVVTALVEAAGEGSYVAAPVVREVMDYWFHKRLSAD